MGEVTQTAPSEPGLARSQTVVPASPPVLGKKKRGRAKRPVLVILSVAWLVLVASAAMLQPWLPLPDPNESDFSAVGAGPFSPGHLLGADEVGRDILSRVVIGARVSLAVGFGSVAIAILIGGPLGLLAGYFGGLLDRGISAVVDITLAFPPLVALIALSVFLGSDMRTIMIGIGVVGAPQLARITRAATLMYANRAFVTAARGTGASSFRVLRRELVPNVVIPVLSYALIFVAIAVIAEGGLSFLGLGVPPPQASWGTMMGSGRAEMATDPHIVLVPAFVMFVTLVALNFLGDHMGKRFDTKESSL